MKLNYLSANGRGLIMLNTGKFVGIYILFIVFLFLNIAGQGSPVQHTSLCKVQESELVVSRFRVLVLYENGGHHLAFSKAAIPFIDSLSKKYDFDIDYIQTVKFIDSAYLSNYDVFFQLDYPPYTWAKKGMDALQSFITKGKISWIGLHHATLIGEFDGYPMWDWFYWFMGGIRFKNYIASLSTGNVDVTLPEHPVMEGISKEFRVSNEEWYTYDKLPDNYIEVLATVDESSYQPNSNVKMHGIHPVVWTNKNVKGRNLYIFMGHHPSLFYNENYKRLLRNAILWAGGRF